MIAVIFEVWTKPDRQQDYLAIAATLRPELQATDGFPVDRTVCESLRRGKIAVAVVLAG